MLPLFLLLAEAGGNRGKLEAASRAAIYFSIFSVSALGMRGWPRTLSIRRGGIWHQLAFCLSGFYPKGDRCER
jgi:hypothetical protein